MPKFKPYLLLAFFVGALFLCGCGNIKGPKFPHIVSPRVIVETPASPVSGNISISFQLIDREQESAGVALEYSTDAGQTFHTATLTNPAEATGLASDWHPGVTHTIQWDSVTDMIGLSGPADVCVRVAPSDASNPSGTADISSTFTVNNIAYNQASAATVSTPAGIQSGNIQITYTLTDAEGDTCSITVLYSGSGGTTWATATMGPAGDGLTGLSSSPSGISHTFLWNSRADSVALTTQQDNVRIRITPTDFKDGTVGETNSFSVDNRIFTDFSASPRSGEAPLLVSFTDLSTAFSGITSWSWDFGDGGTSIVQHPDHTYTTAGSYTVSLTVTGPDGSCTETKTNYISVMGPPTVTGITPAPDALLLDTPPDSVVVSFSNEIDSSTISNDTFKLLASGGDGAFTDGNETPVTLTSVTRTAPTQVTMDLTGVSLPDDTYQVTARSDFAGKALSLDGSNDVVTILETVSMDFSTPKQLTVEAWIWIQSFPSIWGEIVSKWGSGSNEDDEFALHLASDGRLNLTISPSAGGDTSIYSSNPLETDRLYHVAGTWNGNTQEASVYVNGSEVAHTDSAVLTIHDCSEPLRLGSCGHPEFFQGTMDEVRIWNIARTQAQIQADLYRSLTGTETGLVGYYRFDEGSGQVVNDSSPLGNHGTRGADANPGTDDPAWVDSTAPIAGGVKDTDGYYLDGEYTGSLPSGDGTEGGNFVSTFVISKRPTVGSIAPNYGESGAKLTGMTVVGTNFNKGNNPPGAVAFGDHYYLFVSDVKTWHEAKADCETRGGHLATLSSAAEDSFVYNLGLQQKCWLGFTDEGNEGTWRCVTGDPLTYTNWASSQPDNSGGAEHFAEYYGAMEWNDSVASYNKPYVCEFDEWTSPAVHLSMSGQADIVATNVWFTDSENLTFDIDLTGAALGAWDVVVTNPDGGSGTLPGGFTVMEPQPPVADFSADRTTGPVSLLVRFTDASTGIVTSWSWDFGDSGTSTQQNPSHYYRTVGTYTVSLSASGPGGSDTRTRAGYITVTEQPPSGLADSAWPVRGQNEQRTGCSPHFGPQTNRIARTYPMGWGFGYFAPVIDEDGIIYSGCWDSYLHAFNPDTTIKWKYNGKGNLSPCIAADGTVLWGGTSGKSLLALDPADGSEKWYYNVGGTPGLCPSPIIGTDGTVYVASSDGGLYAINSDGTLKWRFDTGSNVEGFPALATDGTIYAGNDAGLFFAINQDGTEKWRYTDTSAIKTDIVVADDGTIYYCAGGALTALYPSGSFKWSVLGIGAQRPSIAPDGTIVSNHSGQGYIAINPDSSERWRYNIGYNVLVKPAIGADGTVYVGSWGSRIRALEIEDGSVKWAFDSAGAIESHPMIGPDGALYFGSNNGEIFAFRDAAPEADFTASPLTGTRPLLVNFTDASTGTIAEWLWNFGDGQTSTEQNPSLTYTKAGTYTVSLSVKGPSGATAKTMKDYITVTE